MMRVLFLHYLDDVRAGGSLRVGQLLANHLPPEDVEVRILFAYGDKGPVAEQSKVRVDYARVGGRWDVLGWLRFRKYIREFNPDILHFQDPLTVGRCFLSGLSARRITHCHGRPLHRPKTLGQRVNAWWQRWDTDLFVCIDHVAAEVLERTRLARPGQCVVLSNGVDFDFLQKRPSRSSACKTLGLPIDVKLLGMVCRVVEHKGFPDLFRQMTFLPPEWHAVVFGEGADRLQLQARAQKLRLAERIHFVGPLNDVRPAYAAMDAYFFACAHEAFGLAMAEAMASQVPVFGLHGLGEYREHEPPLIDESVAILLQRKDTNRLYDPKQVVIPEADDIQQNLAARIAAFDPTAKSSQSMLRAASERIRDHFEIHSRAIQLSQIYRELLSRRSKI
jgi:glycosyltransferase involved in cell wall biosynthesis